MHRLFYLLYILVLKLLKLSWLKVLSIWRTIYLLLLLNEIIILLEILWNTILLFIYIQILCNLRCLEFNNSIHSNQCCLYWLLWSFILSCWSSCLRRCILYCLILRLCTLKRYCWLIILLYLWAVLEVLLRNIYLLSIEILIDRHLGLKWLLIILTYIIILLQRNAALRH